MEDHIPDVTTPIVSGHIYSSEFIANDSAPDSSCSTRIDSTEYYSVSENLVLRSIQKMSQSSQTDECTTLQLYTDGGDTAGTIDRSNAKKRRISIDKDYSEDLEWQTEKYFE